MANESKISEFSSSPYTTVRKTYDDAQAARFYQIVMGDGGGQLHYGIYKTGKETFSEATNNSIDYLLDLLRRCGGIDLDASSAMRILDSGSGNGGSSHRLTQISPGISITCVNLCVKQNVLNKKLADGLGLGPERISIHTGSYDDLPRDWSRTFDVVWSQDAYLHAPDKEKVLQENFRVLVKNGFVVMSDIMASPFASKAQLQIVKDRLHLDELSTIDDWIDTAQRVGFKVVATRDLTPHLKQNYVQMAERGRSERKRMQECSDDFIEQYVKSLEENIDMLAAGEAQTWFAMVLKKE